MAATGSSRAAHAARRPLADAARAAAAIGGEGWPLDGESPHFADRILRIEAIAVGRDFANRNHFRGLGGIDRHGPPFGQKKGAEHIPDLVLDPGLKTSSLMPSS